MDKCEDELDVYDQCCGNCRNTKCPAYGPSEDDLENVEEAERQFWKEDCVEKDGLVIWCIHWKGYEPKRNYNDTDE